MSSCSAVSRSACGLHKSRLLRQRIGVRKQAFLQPSCPECRQLPENALLPTVAQKPDRKYQFSSVQWLHPARATSLQPMDCNMPGFPVRHQLPELAQTHVHQSVMPSNHLCCVASRCAAQALGLRAPIVVLVGLDARWRVACSHSRDPTHVPCISRWMHILCTTREVPL